jgi:hypothetical protein
MSETSLAMTWIQAHEVLLRPEEVWRICPLGTISYISDARSRVIIQGPRLRPKCPRDVDGRPHSSPIVPAIELTPLPLPLSTSNRDQPGSLPLHLHLQRFSLA